MKKILRWAGFVLGVIGVVFVVFKLFEYGGQLNFSRFTIFDFFIIIALTVIYALSVTILAIAWKLLLKKFGVEVTDLCAINIFGVSQLAKYIPGNIIHLASRQSLGMASGISGWSLAKTSAWELGLVSLSAAFFCILLLPYFSITVSGVWVLIMFVSIVAIVVAGLGKYLSVQIAYAVVLYTVFFVLTGLVFAGLFAFVIGGNLISFQLVLLLCGAFVVSLLLGMVTPGAPAGVGVRELMLVLFLNGLVAEADMLLAVLISRVITVGGDLLFFLIATLLPCRKNEF